MLCQYRMILRIELDNDFLLMTRLFRTLPLLLLITSCTAETGLTPFASDGCSLFPDNSLINADDWCSCCFEHDLAYWRGGTSQERASADKTLEECVFEKTRNRPLAKLMFEGVRFGGSPYFYNWYRWGYGWNFDRKYQALTPEENKTAENLIKKYFIEKPLNVCRN